MTQVDLLCAPAVSWFLQLWSEWNIQCSRTVPSLYREIVLTDSLPSCVCYQWQTTNRRYALCRPATNHGAGHHISRLVGFGPASRHCPIIWHISAEAVQSAQSSYSVIGSLAGVWSVFSETALHCRTQTEFQILLEYFKMNSEKNRF